MESINLLLMFFWGFLMSQFGFDFTTHQFWIMLGLTMGVSINSRICGKRDKS